MHRREDHKTISKQGTMHQWNDLVTQPKNQDRLGVNDIVDRYSRISYRCLVSSSHLIFEYTWAIISF